jgi:hypothetical protein
MCVRVNLEHSDSRRSFIGWLQNLFPCGHAAPCFMSCGVSRQPACRLQLPVDITLGCENADRGLSMQMHNHVHDPNAEKQLTA